MVNRMMVAALMLAAPAAAQRANENAAQKAEDAFGTSIGGEQIGIYNPGYVRGFSATEAGNIRLDGLYIDQQASFTDRLVGGLQMRVGLSAQSYPFPAPTGIADFGIRRPGDRRIVSTQLRFGPYNSLVGEVDAQLPVSGTLNLGIGGGLFREHTNFGGSPVYASTALIAHWRPLPNLEVTPFFSGILIRSEEAQPLLFTDGKRLPPRVPRGPMLGQDWTETHGGTGNSGLLLRYERGDWTLRGGLFRSVFDLERSFTSLFLNVQPDGLAQEAVIADPQRRFVSTSGEMRLTRRFAEGDRLHALHVSLRGRTRGRVYGGGQFVALGTHSILEPVDYAEPDFVFGPRTRDRVRQLTAGIAYEGRWRDVGELSLGMQKTTYSKTVDAPAGPRPPSKDAPWLFNGTVAAYLSENLAVYAGYTRGLEESPVAPEIAVNKDEAPPAIRTQQVDAGLRWTVSPGVRLVAGLFEVSKPYFNLDADSIFGRLGEIRHRGAEFSLSGPIAPGVTAVLGTVLLDPVLSGPAVDSGQLGRRPVASFTRLTNAVLEYRPPAFPALSVDMVFESTSDRIASPDGAVLIPARSVMAVGGRYRFQLAGAPATLRAQIGNAGNNFGFANGSSGYFVFNQPRRATLTLTADL